MKARGKPRGILKRVFEITVSGTQYRIRTPSHRSSTITVTPVEAGRPFRLKVGTTSSGDRYLIVGHKAPGGAFLKGTETTNSTHLKIFRRVHPGERLGPSKRPVKAKESFELPPDLRKLEITTRRELRYEGQRVTAIWSRNRPNTVFLVDNAGTKIATIYRHRLKAYQPFRPGRAFSRSRETLRVITPGIRRPGIQRPANLRELGIFNTVVGEGHEFDKVVHLAELRRRRPLK